MVDLQRHRIDIERAIADGKAGRDEIFAHLMALTAEERGKISPALFARLTESQLNALLGWPPNSKTSTFRPIRESNRKRKFYLPPLPALRTALAGALAVAIVGGVASFPMMSQETTTSSPIVRSLDTRTWPGCPRLDAGTDGCIYTVQSALTLDEASIYLALPVTQLRAINPRLPTTSLPAGTQIVVWRGQGTLTR
ncbi:MAG: hypothetical protein ACT6Q8_03820 [Niveispirillum sp.]|uniref:hypothetical protein n=1 Tax=Niveispirillum sp. TaxID=1917217 RepID=UPI004035C706